MAHEKCCLGRQVVLKIVRCVTADSSPKAPAPFKLPARPHPGHNSDEHAAGTQHLHPSNPVTSGPPSNASPSYVPIPVTPGFVACTQHLQAPPPIPLIVVNLFLGCGQPIDRHHEEGLVAGGLLKVRDHQGGSSCTCCWWGSRAQAAIGWP